MFNCHLLSSLALLCQEQDTAMKSVTDPTYPSGKHSVLVTLPLGSREAEAISGPCPSHHEETREHHLLKRFGGIWWLLDCAPKLQSRGCPTGHRALFRGLSTSPCSVANRTTLGQHLDLCNRDLVTGITMKPIAFLQHTFASSPFPP